MRQKRHIIKGLAAMADIAGVSRQTIARWYLSKADNGIPIARRGRNFYADRDALLAWLAGETSKEGTE